MPERPIICQAIAERVPVFGGETGSVVGHRDQYKARRAHIRLKAGKIEHLVDQQNRVVERTSEGKWLEFPSTGVLEVTERDWTEAGMTREQAVAVLREEGKRPSAPFEVVSEVGVRDARKPDVPTGAGR